MTTRRTLIAGIGLAGLFGLATRHFGASDPVHAAETFPVEKSEAEWRKQLTPQQFDILRKQGTERPYTSPLNKEHREGIFACVGCDQKLYSSDTKFESGTGWPSFYKPLPNAIGTHVDKSFLMERTEVHCARCGGHLGHVFDDGPKPTGLRYCMNGVAMKFLPKDARVAG